MDRNVIVMVVDPEDRKRGEITVMDDPKEAARYAESLLIAGLEQDRIRVFTASEVQVSVTHRPVVTLVAPGDERSATETQGRGQEAPSAEGEGARQEPEEPTPFVQNGVRFSSLFRPS